MMNFKNMMQQAQQMQFKLQEMQEKLKDLLVEGTSGAGLVKVVMACSGDVKTLHIDPSLLTPADKETVEDLIVAALNNAHEAKESRIKTETQNMMELLGLPKDAKLPF